MLTYNLVLSLFIAACESESLDTGRDPSLSAPTLISITTFGPPYGMTVEWQPVEHDQSSITGYKVKMWENEKIAIIHKERHRKGVVWIKEFIINEKPIHVIPNTDPFVLMVSRFETQARIGGIHLGVPYQVRVQAFSELGDGPYSNPLAVKIHGKPRWQLAVDSHIELS